MVELGIVAGASGAFTMKHLGWLGLILFVCFGVTVGFMVTKSPKS